MRRLGISATRLGLRFVLVSRGFMAGGLIARQLPNRWGTGRLVLVGTALGLAATVWALLLALAGVWTVAAIIAPAALLGVANGIAMPNAQAGAMAAVKNLSGTASGLSGFLGTIIGAAATQAVAMLLDGTPYPIVVAMAGRSALALGAAWLAFARGRTAAREAAAPAASAAGMAVERRNAHARGSLPTVAH